MNSTLPGILHFRESYFERIWGGQRLQTVYGKHLPTGKPIGEAWMISDHAACESAVDEGPLSGKSLRTLLLEDAPAILGTSATLTPHGRFPLLLKVLDASDVLSVQVHPDDATAHDLGEPDVGKTEMWHVLQADLGSELICGLSPEVSADDFAVAATDGSLETAMIRFGVSPGTSVFVPAGIVHAIGAGILLAEIQQNSDLTYRLYDWGRVDAEGKPRPLHVDKAMRAIHFGSLQSGAATPLMWREGDVTHSLHAACRYFATHEITTKATWVRQTNGTSFHILFGKVGTVNVSANGTTRDLASGEAILIPGCVPTFTIQGNGSVLDYYVPDLLADIVNPLRQVGFTDDTIANLAGVSDTSDLRAVMR